MGGACVGATLIFDGVDTVICDCMPGRSRNVFERSDIHLALSRILVIKSAEVRRTHVRDVRQEAISELIRRPYRRA